MSMATPPPKHSPANLLPQKYGCIRKENKRRKMLCQVAIACYCMGFIYLMHSFIVTNVLGFDETAANESSSSWSSSLDSIIQTKTDESPSSSLDNFLQTKTNESLSSLLDNDIQTEMLEEMKLENVLQRLKLEGNGTQTVKITKALEVLLAETLIKREIKDDTINVIFEGERCKRYGYSLGKNRKRRRIFFGSLIADDSWEVLSLLAMEIYGMVHTVAFVESNQTHSRFPRKERFLNESSMNYLLLTRSGMFGPSARVSVDHHHRQEPKSAGENIENLQRELVLERWKQNGMTKEDIGYLGDVDEAFTRDFLRALQICDVPQFRPDQDCKKPKVLGSTLNFQGSLLCPSTTRGFHPDIIIGECISTIGPSSLNGEKNGVKLWSAGDFKIRNGGLMVSGVDGLHTAFHFHNFFSTINQLRFKYRTFGHVHKFAKTAPLDMLNDDLHFMVDCVMNRSLNGNVLKSFDRGVASILKASLPVAYQQVESYAKLRHEELRGMLEEDEKSHPRIRPRHDEK